jgi:hypothetical protein
MDKGWLTVNLARDSMYRSAYQAHPTIVNSDAHGEHIWPNLVASPGMRNRNNRSNHLQCVMGF